MAEQSCFQNGRKLLEFCIEKLSENRNGVMGGNYAIHPTVIIMLGKMSSVYTKYIKDTLDDNWNNSRFLQYVNIIKKEETINCYVLSGNEKRTELNWRTVENSFQDTLSRAIVEMLVQDDKYFADKSRVKMEFVLDATEEDSREYYKLYLEAKSGLPITDLKTLYLALDQIPEGGKSKRSDEFLHFVLSYASLSPDQSRSNCGTTYLLSNYLESGAILGKNKIWQNYRLIADIILLGGNKDSDRYYVNHLYNGIKTVSYALVTKPTDEIAAVSLQTLLQELYVQEKEHYQGELSDQEIRDRLEMTPANGFKMADQIFREKMQGRLPQLPDLQYLPFASKRDWKKFRKYKDFSQGEGEITLSAWNLFVQEKYIYPVREFIGNAKEQEQIRQHIQDKLHSEFSFFDINNLHDRKDLIERMIKEDFQSTGVNENAEATEKIHSLALYECKKEFYVQFKKILWEEFRNLFSLAVSYDAMYAQCKREIQLESMIDQKGGVQKVYPTVVKQYLLNNQPLNTSQSVFSEVFDIRQNKETFLSSIWNVFFKLIQEEEVYNYDFEKEVHFRMDNLPDSGGQQFEFVKNLLKSNLEGSTRLKNVLEYGKRPISCFYLINETADYAKQLEAERKHGNSNYMLFYLNRTDCIEQLEICDITKPGYLHLDTEVEEVLSQDPACDNTGE